MAELHPAEQAADKLDEEYDILERMGPPSSDPAHVSLLLQQAKRVRRESTLLVRALAQLRDNLQPGGTR